MHDANLKLAFSRAEDTVYAFAASPDAARDGICFAASSAGLFRSQDAGESWMRLPASSEEVTTALALSPAFAQDRTVFAAVKGGVLRSSDGGDNWFVSAFPAPPPLFSSLVASPDFERDGALLAASLEDGVFASSDRGLRWQPWNFGLIDLAALCLALSPRFMEDETVFAGTETGLYRSANGGRAWRMTDFPSECAPVLCLAHFHDPHTGASALYAGSETQGLFASPDGGQSWRSIEVAGMTGPVNQLHVWRGDAGGAQLYALADSGLWRGDAAGQSWRAILPAAGELSAMLPLGDSLLLGARGQGILRLSTEPQ